MKRVSHIPVLGLCSSTVFSGHWIQFCFLSNTDELFTFVASPIRGRLVDSLNTFHSSWSLGRFSSRAHRSYTWIMCKQFVLLFLLPFGFLLFNDDENQFQNWFFHSDHWLRSSCSIEAMRCGIQFTKRSKKSVLQTWKEKLRALAAQLGCVLLFSSVVVRVAKS